MSARRKTVITLVVVGAALGLIGIGTYATFTAQAGNPNSTFSTGTLVISNKVGSGSACLSTGGGTTDVNANASCDQAFNLTVKKPGDSGSANITIQNSSLAASVFKVFSQACATSDAAGESYHGTGNSCGVIDVYVQEYSDSGFTTESACQYGGGTATVCAFDDTKTLSTFQSAHNSSANGLSLGSLAAGGDSGSVRYFKIGVKMPTSAGNSYQGRAAAIDFTWYAAQ
jgi:hypothetical protein